MVHGEATGGGSDAVDTVATSLGSWINQRKIKFQCFALYESPEIMEISSVMENNYIG